MTSVPNWHRDTLSIRRSSKRRWFRLMIFSNYHTHTTYCDGNDAPETLVLKAIELGCPEIGFTGHSFTWFDPSYCMLKEDVVNYRLELEELKEKYKRQIKVLIGIEQDYYCDESTEGFDYVIGSVHYVLKDGNYIPVDETQEMFIDDVKKHYDGDYYAFAEDYYSTVAKVYEKTKCDIIAHFDLFTKFNNAAKSDVTSEACDFPLFDTTDPRYVDAALKALSRLKSSPALFEVNLSGLKRGEGSEPYPQSFILDEINAAKKSVILSADCHNRESLIDGFDESYQKLLSLGFARNRIITRLSSEI